MPNSNPACRPPSDTSCTNDGINWAEIYPEICLSAGPESIPLTVVGLNAWDGCLSEYCYILQCSANRWLLERSLSQPPWTVDVWFASGGTIPNLVFPDFTTAAGEC